MMHRMQITRELWEYDLMTTSVKFMQQTALPLCQWLSGRQDDCMIFNNFLKTKKR